MNANKYTPTVASLKSAQSATQRQNADRSRVFESPKYAAKAVNVHPGNVFESPKLVHSPSGHFAPEFAMDKKGRDKVRHQRVCNMMQESFSGFQGAQRPGAADQHLLDQQRQWQHQQQEQHRIQQQEKQEDQSKVARAVLGEIQNLRPFVDEMAMAKKEFAKLKKEVAEACAQAALKEEVAEMKAQMELLRQRQEENNQMVKTIFEFLAHSGSIRPGEARTEPDSARDSPSSVGTFGSNRR